MRRAARPIPKNRQTPAIRRKLLQWYDRHHRQLPWRKTSDPYRIWISEVMLQQTRVRTVVPYYEKFLRAFPNVETLAKADERALLACWSGLGYYARARNLQKAARMIVSEYGGRFPCDCQAAPGLPGIGRYTAAAVLSMAYGIPLPVLDGNVARLLSRLYAMDTDFKSAAGQRSLLQQAGTLLSRRHPGEFNQAMMELGATLCLPRRPQCHLCPLQNDCRARLQGQVEQYPPWKPKAKPVARKLTAALIRDNAGRVLLVRRPQTARRMAGFWELPMWESRSQRPIAGDQNEPSKDGIVLGPLLGRFRHSITSSRLEVAVFAGRLNRRASLPDQKWIAPRQVRRLPITTVTRKALGLV